ncbi:Rab5 GDP/GTP exchange factor [Sarcoptes scabiei]|nr:Rab5 GDP/GTP exchange factor [Sarcoptes scabiei]
MVIKIITEPNNLNQKCRHSHFHDSVQKSPPIESGPIKSVSAPLIRTVFEFDAKMKLFFIASILSNSINILLCSDVENLLNRNRKRLSIENSQTFNFCQYLNR